MRARKPLLSTEPIKLDCSPQPSHMAPVHLGDTLGPGLLDLFSLVRKHRTSDFTSRRLHLLDIINRAD